ncbi:MAG: hypothetical protein VZQ27_01875 [Candidatus Cryptobacteroides sp.]|jgi:hypothetical protein|nr:hypothetical protein [Bacteroidales bacterium]MEE3463028.1 hypothetical protein [Candidatus Cryptobacteroides sp.]
MAILSQASEIEEGAETRHGTPKGNNSYGEGIVQTTKSSAIVALAVAKAIVARKSLGQ